VSNATLGKLFTHTCASVSKQYNLVPANGRWCLAAGKVTIGLASHWPHVTDISGSPATGSWPSTCLRYLSGGWLTLPVYPTLATVPIPVI